MLNEQKIADVKTVSGIDALYYQLQISKDNYTEFYVNCISNNVEMFENMTILSPDWSKQYTSFQYSENGEDIAIIYFKKPNDKDGLEDVKVQLYTTYMNTYGVKESYYKIVEKLNNLGLDVLGDKITRIDLNTYVYGYDFKYIDVRYFKTLLQKDSEKWGVKEELETFTMGSRKNNKAPFLRIYNKWLELFENDNEQMKQAIIAYKFYKTHGILLDIEKPLWQVEWELKRDFLKRYTINTVFEALESLNFIHNELMDSHILMYRRFVNKKKENIIIAPIWNKIREEYNYNDSDLPRNKIKMPKYTKDERWLQNRIDEYLAENDIPNNLQMELLKEVLETVKRKLEVIRINNSIINNRLKNEMN